MSLEQKRPVFDNMPEAWDDQALTRALGHSEKQAHDRMLRRFFAHTGEQLRDMWQLCEQGDFRAIGALAHNAKSAARTVGAMQLGHLCAQLESSCDEGDTSIVRRQVVAIQRAYEAIQTYLP